MNALSKTLTDIGVQQSNSPTPTSPLNTAPLNTAPLNAAPLNTAPLNTAPLNTAPLNTIITKDTNNIDIINENITDEELIENVNKIMNIYLTNHPNKIQENMVELIKTNPTNYLEDLKRYYDDNNNLKKTVDNKGNGLSGELSGELFSELSSEASVQSNNVQPSYRTPPSDNSSITLAAEEGFIASAFAIIAGILFAGGKGKSKNKKIKQNKTKKVGKNLVGGKVINSGGFGCVFEPVLKCKGKKREVGTNQISKLMKTNYAKSEYNDIMKYLPIFKKIPNYANYFVIEHISICKPDKLTTSDLNNYSNCYALKKKQIFPYNINKKLNTLMMINEPNGGIELDDFIPIHYKNHVKMKILNNSLIELLLNGIIPMNKLKIYHCDIKGSNILVDDYNKNHLYSRLIDWGLSNVLNNNTMQELGRRPMQFNLPYSIILFDGQFINDYAEFLMNNHNVDYTKIYGFISIYIAKNHKDYLQTIMNIYRGIFKDKDKSTKHVDLYTLKIIVTYISQILFKYTRHNQFYIHEYLPIFLQNVDIWGFVIAYNSIIKYFNNPKYNVTNYDKNIINQIRLLIHELVASSISPINIDSLINKLQKLTNIITSKIHNNTIYETHSKHYSKKYSKKYSKQHNKTIKNIK
jgi:hypothetical protein